jgi:quinol monooxygenase YgiN
VSSANGSADEVSAIIAKFGTELADSATPFTLLCQFTVKPEMQGLVKAALAEARAATVGEEGVIAFDLNQGAADPARFTVYERWRNLAALEAHLRTSYITVLRDRINAAIVGAPEFQVLRPVDESPSVLC